MGQSVLSDLVTQLLDRGDRHKTFLQTIFQSLLKRKGIRLIFLNLNTEIWFLRKHKVVTQAISKTLAGVSGRVLFSLYTMLRP